MDYQGSFIALLWMDKYMQTETLDSYIAPCSSLIVVS